MISPRSEFKKGRIHVDGHYSPKKALHTGIQYLVLDGDRDTLLYIPKTYTGSQPSPFVLLLHGAGGKSEHGMFLLQELAEKAGIILLAPSSHSNSWDLIDEGAFNRDVILIQQVMEIVLEACVIDRHRLAIGGFSDGASYALSLGLINGDFFSHIMAFSPGFYQAPVTAGKPNIFISHGLLDEVLPVQRCSRRIVPKLQKEGYKVTYHEFNGGHVIPHAISEEAVKGFL